MEDREKAADQGAAADAAWAADRAAGGWAPAAEAQAPVANVYARIAELLRRIRSGSPACSRNAPSAALSWRENEKYRSDFSDAGFALIDRVHGTRGTAHEREAGDFSIVGVFLKEHGFNVTVIEDRWQILYSALRKNI